MNTYKLTLQVEVEVESFSEDDARDVILDVFGPGNDCGVEVKNLVITSA